MNHLTLHLGLLGLHPSLASSAFQEFNLTLLILNDPHEVLDLLLVLLGLHLNLGFLEVETLKLDISLYFARELLLLLDLSIGG